MAEQDPFKVEAVGSYPTAPTIFYKIRKVELNNSNMELYMKYFNCLNCGKENVLKGKSYVGKYCNNKCQAEHRTANWFINNKPLFEQGLLTSRAAVKKFIKLRDGNNCSICTQPPEHNGKPLIMILDHIDGDASNNMPDNFRLVCPNCDTQLDTYKARNMGNGRATKGMKWYSRL